MASETDAHQLHVAVIGGDPAVRQSHILHSTFQEMNAGTLDANHDYLHLIDIPELETDDSEQKGTDALRRIAELSDAGNILRAFVIILPATVEDGQGSISTNETDWIQQVRSANTDAYTVLVKPSSSEPASVSLYPSTWTPFSGPPAWTISSWW